MLFRVGNPVRIGDGPAAVTGYENDRSAFSSGSVTDTGVITGLAWRNILTGKSLADNRREGVVSRSIRKSEDLLEQRGAFKGSPMGLKTPSSFA